MNGTPKQNHGIVLVAKRMKNDKILKLYLGHFIYVPAAIIYSLVVGEDFEVLIFITFLSLIGGGFAFAFNYFITLFSLSIFKLNSLLSFLLPVVIGLILYYPLTIALQHLDIGGSNAYVMFLTVSIIINLATFLALKAKGLGVSKKLQ